MSIEVCVDSVESAIIAQKCGADRLEVCMSLVTGGITPHIPFIRTIRDYVNRPIHVLIRPRYGDFLYSTYEVLQMRRYIESLQTSGLVQGVVIGALTSESALDVSVMKQLMQSAQGLKVTCHRCFDMIQDQITGLHTLMDLGVDCVLTSGGKNSAFEGLENLVRLNAVADGCIEIMPGAGINEHNFKQIKKALKPKYMHLSAKTILPSKMNHRNEALSMGQTGFDEYSVLQTSEDILKRIVELDSEVRVDFRHNLE